MADWTTDIKNANLQFEQTFKARDFTAMSELYTEDVNLMAPGQTVRKGRQACADTFTALSGMGGAVLSITTEEVIPRGDIAVERGSFVIHREDGSIFDQGKVLVIWKRVGEQVLVCNDIWNSDIPK